MTVLALVAAASLLGLTPSQSMAAMPVADPGTVLTVATARERWLHALAAAGWDRDDPTVSPVADEITALLLPLATAHAGSEVDVEAVTLLTQIAGAPLGAYVHTQAAPDRSLTRGWLRWHDDPAVFQRWVAELSQGAQGSTVEAITAVDLASRHRPSMAPVLARAIGQTDGGLREQVCGAALLLPPSARSPVAEAVARVWRGPAPDDAGFACLVLGGGTSAGRHELARWIAHLPPAHDTHAALHEPSWIVPAALVLAGTEEREGARESAARIRDGIHLLSGFAHLLPPVIGAVSFRAPAARHLLALLATSMSNTFVPLLAARMVIHDDTLLVQASEALASTRVDGAILRSAVAVAGLLPARDPSTQTSVRTLLLSLRERLHASSSSDVVNVAGLDRWIQAIDGVGACHGQHGCLVDEILHGADAASARAVMVLGPSSLTSLTLAQQRSLVGRLMIHPDPWLLLAVLSGIQGCPHGLRGLREIDDALEFDDAHAGLQPLLGQFEAACATSR